MAARKLFETAKRRVGAAHELSRTGDGAIAIFGVNLQRMWSATKCKRKACAKHAQKTTHCFGLPRLVPFPHGDAEEYVPGAEIGMPEHVTFAEAKFVYERRIADVGITTPQSQRIDPNRWP